jgi:hypothetical protein
MSNLWQQLNGDMSTIVESVRRNLVQISNGRRGSGAGTLWHANGLIVVKNLFQGTNGFYYS